MPFLDLLIIRLDDNLIVEIILDSVSHNKQVGVDPLGLPDGKA